MLVDILLEYGWAEEPAGVVTVGVTASAGDTKLTEGGFTDFALPQ